MAAFAFLARPRTGFLFRDSVATKYLPRGVIANLDELGVCFWRDTEMSPGNNGRNDNVAEGEAVDQASNRDAAKAWIRENCVAQWVVVEDEALRIWSEHYILSVLRPIWGC